MKVHLNAIVDDAHILDVSMLGWLVGWYHFMSIKTRALDYKSLIYIPFKGTLIGW